MSNLEIAAKIYNESHDGKDISEVVLKILELTNGKNISEIIAAYELIKTGEIKLVEVVTSFEMDNDQKQSLEVKLASLISEKFVIAYKVDPNVQNGIAIRLGDNLIDLN